MLALLGHAPVVAADLKPRAGATSDAPVQTRVDYRFEHAVPLEVAIELANANGGEIVAYRFENEQFVGEYSPLSGVTPKDYLADLMQELGTSPEVVGYTVSVTADSGRALGAESAIPLSVRGEPEFSAPVVRQSFFDQQRAWASSAARELDSGSARMAGDWKPDMVSANIVKQPSGGRIDFDMAALWDSPSTPGYIPSDYGLEISVDLYNNWSSTDLRPFCTNPSPRDQFFAKNYGWNWHAVDEQFGWLAAAVPYADYNDLSDPCNRNSMAIGLRTPQAIPLAYYNAPYDWAVFFYIDAPPGNQTINRISGDVSIVTEAWCVSYPNYSNTDCMGVAQPGPGAPDLHRGFLDVDRHWTAPNKCWSSLEKGNDPPILMDPTVPGSGCPWG
ncbi:hypothetical protein SAMN05880545_1020 [Microbacterium sp. RU33B]|nr:hypothetical protein SAMN05880545_1020 [Microbacterium sp. RU33B]